ncbi:MAG: UDP-N-acetylmuramoyl-L-alanine--D-glutamate ligase, partial [Aliifodinibius sp.]|nr:UDP-N-acetylmuramoyl-L-alanine--D-glutamate ligase [Fodinibius sp.]
MAVAQLLNININKAIDTIKSFNGLEHRTEVVAEVNGVLWINDSKATNVGATIAAINGISRPIILMLGGIAKEANFSDLCDVMPGKVKKAIVYGRDSKT